MSRGYSIEFTAPPPSFQGIRRTPVPRDPPRRKALLQEIDTLLTKRAIVQLPNLAPSGFYSTFFLTPKKSGEWRPILNLKPLNKYIRPRRFRMETLRAVVGVLSPHQWGATLDLQDAYLHIPIDPGSQKWLRFALNNRAYQFQVLPFGLSTAPRTFTRIVKVIAEFLRRRGIQVYVYLDDWLLVAPSAEALTAQASLVCRLVESLGFLINHKKSDLVPSQNPQFLGAVLDFHRGRVVPTEQRITDTSTLAEEFCNRPSAPARSWLRLLGLMASLIDMVPLCRLHMRRIQIHFLSHYRAWCHPLSWVVQIPKALLPTLRWWVHTDNLRAGLLFRTPIPMDTLTTDASKRGWGAHFRSIRMAGRWSRVQARFHINLLELWAVFLALRFLGPRVRGLPITVRCDNMTVVTYLNKEGGTRSPLLCKETIKLLLWCHKRGISLHAEHLPGVDNTIADALSRLGSQSGGAPRLRGASVEWHLNPVICQWLFNRTIRPHVDLFASSRDHQLPTYFSWEIDPMAAARDAMAQDWSNSVAFAFPPLAMIPRVLEKLAQSRKCLVLLLAPLWPRQVWFPRLLDLLVAAPVALPERRDLLSIPRSRTRVPPRTIRTLHLTAWLLSAEPSRRRDFLKKLPVSQQRQGEVRPDELMIPDYSDSLNGVPTVKLIHIQQL